MKPYKNKKEKKIKFKTLGILNMDGEFWTKKTFQTWAEAENYMHAFWGNIKNPPDMSKHEIVEVEVIYKTK